MNTRYALFLLSGLIVSASLSACSSKMTRKECDGTDFYKMGENDGSDGKSPDRFNRVVQECTALGAQVPAQQYQSGRTVGLSKFCTESRAKSDARNGKTDSICVQEKFPPYMSAFQIEVGSLKEKRSREMENLKSDQSKTQQKMNDTQNELNKLESEKNAAGAR